jgi:cytochrome c biogenesis protein CcdA
MTMRLEAIWFLRFDARAICPPDVAPKKIAAGIISFLSPCVLPLVPPYLIYLTGATIEHGANDEAVASSKRAVMISALVFVFGLRGHACVAGRRHRCV